MDVDDSPGASPYENRVLRSFAFIDLSGFTRLSAARVRFLDHEYFLGGRALGGFRINLGLQFGRGNRWLDYNDTWLAAELWRLRAELAVAEGHCRSFKKKAIFNGRGEGQGGVAGFAKGGAEVELQEDGGETILTYKATAQVGGKLLEASVCKQRKQFL